MARKSYQEVEADAYKAVQRLVEQIQPIWTDSMTPQQAAIATKSVILTTLHEVTKAAQQTLALEGKS